MNIRISQTAAAAAALTLLVSAPVLAQQTPGDDGTSANGPITIIKNAVAETTPIRVAIDGGEVEHLRRIGYDDITGIVHPGRNTMTVRWNGPVQRLDFKISYAATRNNFKDILVVRSDATRDATLRSAGSQTYTFTIPG